jgi:hypothetical protein
MKKEIEVKAWLGDEVYIDALESRATITAVSMMDRGLTYQVAWFANGDRNEAYLFPHEFSVRTSAVVKDATTYGTKNWPRPEPIASSP